MSKLERTLYLFGLAYGILLHRGGITSPELDALNSLLVELDREEAGKVARQYPEVINEIHKQMFS